MEISQLEMLLFAENGACVCESDEVCLKRLNEVYDLLEKVDSTTFTLEEYVKFLNILVRFVMCSATSFEIQEYQEVLSLFYQRVIDSPFYFESEI